MSTEWGVSDRETTSAGDYLAMRVVEYPDAPDRCTVYPRSLGDQERMTHWISADRDAFVALDRRR